MGRPVVLSNNQLFVGLDENGLVHDFYYPYVGLDNLTTARSSQHKIGVWVDGVFAWTNGGGWDIKVDFESDALISVISLHSTALNLTLTLRDFIDYEHNALIRRVKVDNEAGEERDIRLFMHQVFQISRAGRGDTAMYVPDDNYILDYKGRCCMLIAGIISSGEKSKDFDQYAVGSYGIEEKDGTFRDAEDGELSGNAVEHGGVDSVIRFQHTTPAHESFDVDYWVVAADSQSDAQVIHTKLKYYPLEERLKATRQHWQEWLAPAQPKLEQIPEMQRIQARKSLLVIKAHCDARGSILASGDSSIFNFGRDYYCYCWPRDAAYALWPLIRLGITDEAKLFFDFARDTMHRDGYLMHKYQPDRAIGSTWHPLVHGRSKELAIQEDETAIVVFMLNQYYKATHDHVYVANIYDSFIAPCASFLSEYVDSVTDLPHASYDLWEEKFSTSTYTTCVVIAGLFAAAELADVVDRPDDAARYRRVAQSYQARLDRLYHPDGYFRKGLLLKEDDSLEYDNTLDISSLYGHFRFSGLPIDDPRLVSTAQHVTDRLLNASPTGGVIRYEHDGYFLKKQQYNGNPWIVCTLWLAQYYQAVGKTEEAQGLLQWALDHRTSSGMLSEQFDPDDGTSLGVTPLVWSHAEFINTTLDLNNL